MGTGPSRNHPSRSLMSLTSGRIHYSISSKRRGPKPPVGSPSSASPSNLQHNFITGGLLPQTCLPSTFCTLGGAMQKGGLEYSECAHPQTKRWDCALRPHFSMAALSSWRPWYRPPSSSVITFLEVPCRCRTESHLASRTSPPAVA